MATFLTKNKAPWKLPRSLQATHHDKATSNEGFLIETTVEFVRNYEEYSTKVNVYKQPIFGSQLLGKHNLPLDEALAEEKHIKAQVETSFPQSCEEEVCRAVHHSTKTLDQLITSVHASLKPSKETATDTYKKEASSSKQQQSKAPVSKSLLRAWIVMNCSQIAPDGARNLKIWQVNSSTLRKSYRLADEIPASLKKQQEESIAKAAARKKKRPADGESPSKAEVSKAKKAKTGTEAQASGKKSDAQPVKPKTLDAVEAQYAQGTLKHALFQCLKQVKPEGLTAGQLLEKAMAKNLIQAADEEAATKKKHAITKALSSDINFVRLDTGIYSLHCFHPQVVVTAQSQQQRPQSRGNKDDEKSGGKTDAKKKRPDSSSSPSKAATAKEETKKEEIEVDPDSALGKARLAVKQAKASLKRQKAALSRAKQAKVEAEARLAEAKAQKKNKKQKPVPEVNITPKELAQFELSESDKLYKGHPDDRKAMLEHRQHIQARQRQLEADKKKFIEKELSKRAKEAKEAIGDVPKEEAAVKKAIAAIQQAESAIPKAEKALAHAEKKALDEERKASNQVDRLKQREAKEAAKKYPMEDLDLLQPAEKAKFEAGKLDALSSATDVALPAPLDREESQRLVHCLFITDFLGQFGRALGLKPVSLQDLNDNILNNNGNSSATDNAASTSSSSASGNLDMGAICHALVSVLLQERRDADVASPAEKRWAAVLSSGGPWAEVLRRMILTKRQQQASSFGNDSASLVINPTEERAALAANMLAFDGADSLTSDQRLELLIYLVEEVVSSDRVRGVLQKRLDSRDAVQRDLRDDIAQERKRLKEIAEMKKAKLEGDAAKPEDEQEGEGDTEQPETKKDDTANENKGKKLQKSSSDTLKKIEEANCFELPDDLKEYKGDPKDEEALAAFTKKQQAMRRKLDKERKTWVADMIRKQRQEDAEARAAQEAEEALLKEQAEAKEALIRAQQTIEEKQDKYVVRRAPLGQDRFYRTYFAGIAGDSSKVYVEDSRGLDWCVISTVQEMEALIASLDKRGIRERSLLQAIEKKKDGILNSMQRAAAAAEKLAQQQEAAKKSASQDGAAPIQPRQSSRNVNQPQSYAEKSRGRSAKIVVPKASANSLLASVSVQLGNFVGPMEHAAAEEFIKTMLILENTAVSKAKVAATGGGSNNGSDGVGTWSVWNKAVISLAQGHMPSSSSDGNDGGQAPETIEKNAPSGGNRVNFPLLRNEFKKKLLELEASLCAAGDPPRGAEIVRGGLYSDSEQEESIDTRSMNPISRQTSAANLTEVTEIVDNAFSPSKPLQMTRRLWARGEERAAWLADVQQSLTFSRLCFCAKVLELQSEAFLKTLEEDLNGGAGGSKAGGSGMNKKRKGLPPLPDSMRPNKRTT